jgi:hypothetical protein
MMPELIWTPPAIPPRQRGWETRFAALMEHELAQPFSWGSSDCLTLAADVCEALTGVQPFPLELRDYDSAAGAATVLVKLGFTSISGPLEAVFQPIPSARARRGDCGVRVSAEGELSTFIVLGATAVGRAEGKSRVVVPTLQLAQTFAIGAVS